LIGKSSGSAVAAVNEALRHASIRTLEPPAHTRVDESLEELDNLIIGHLAGLIADNVTDISERRNGGGHKGFLG
jgi:hypothetical protein